MSNDLFDELWSIFKEDLAARSTDGESRFSYEKAIRDPEELDTVLASLVRHKNLCEIRVECTVARGLTLHFKVVTASKLYIEEVGRFGARYRRPDEKALLKPLSRLEDCRERIGSRIERRQLVSDLVELTAGSVVVDLKLRLSIKKEEWLKKLVGEQVAQVVLFVFAENFVKQLRAKTLEEIENSWYRDGKSRPTVFLVLDASGWLRGTYTACFGGDMLDRVGDTIDDPRDFSHLKKSWDLCDEQRGWKGQPEVLTVDHFDVQNRGSEDAGMADISCELGVLAAQFAICYLANRTDGKPDPQESWFYDHPIAVDRQALGRSIKERGNKIDKLISFYRWSYKNHSEALLHVARRAVRVKLEEDAEKNLDSLLSKAGQVQEIANSSLQQAFKGKVDKIFEARKKVCEYLREFTHDIAAIVTGLTDELVGNLYKTLAALIAALVAAGVSDQPKVAFGTAGGLYTVYILFILVYLMPAIWKGQSFIKKNMKAT